MEAEMNILLEDSEWMNTLLQGQKAARDDLMPITQEQLKVSNHQLPSSIAILLNNVLPTSPSLLFANLAAARPVSAFGSGLNLFCICRKDWQRYLPWLQDILLDFEAYIAAFQQQQQQQEQQQEQPAVRTRNLLFAILPDSASMPKYVSLDSNALKVIS